MTQYSCLVVEDTESMRQFLALTVSKLGDISVTEAGDGMEGLRKLAQRSFDIVLTDINMPVMDGLKLIERIRRDPLHKHTPILVITTAIQERERAFKLGANAYLKKPVDATQVLSAVRELLGIHVE